MKCKLLPLALVYSCVSKYSARRGYAEMIVALYSSFMNLLVSSMIPW